MVEGLSAKDRCTRGSRHLFPGKDTEGAEAATANDSTGARDPAEWRQTSGWEGT